MRYFVSAELDESECSALCPRHSALGDRPYPTVSTEQVTRVGSAVKLDALEKPSVAFAGVVATIPGSSRS
jgi:hypothetical protein